MRILSLFITLLLTGSALGAPLDEARVAHAEARADLTRIAAARGELAAAHEQLAAEIEALKTVADNPLLPGVRDPRLDDRLKQARALAEQLGGYDRDAADAEDRVEAARAALVELVDAELTRQRAALAAAPPSERRARFEALGRLVDERQTLARRPSRSAPTPALPEPPDDALASPDELRELADETRDHAEQVRERLAMLESRLGALRERQRLVRAAVAFQRDDALFVQDERNRQRGQREEGVAVATATDRPPTRGDTESGGGGGDVAVEAGDAAEDPGAPAGEPPAAPEADSDGAADDGAEGAFAGRDNDGDGDGDDFDTAAPPTGSLQDLPPSALPDLPSDVSGGAGATLTIEESFDPSLLDELDGLSPDAIARRIRAIERRRQALEDTRRALEARSGALEARARAMESE